MIQGFISSKLIASNTISDLIKEESQQQEKKNPYDSMNHIQICINTPYISDVVMNRDVFKYSFNQIIKNLSIPAVPKEINQKSIDGRFFNN